MIYGYARVSTKGQAHDGNSLESQVKQLQDNGAIEIYQDSFTGTKTDRPEFTKLLNKLQNGDTLIVCKLDRFARSMTQGSQLVNELIEKGIKVNILNIGIMDNTPSSKLIRNIFFSFAEFERDMIVERTQEGKAIAKQNPNFEEGRPKKKNKKQIQQILQLLTVNGGTMSYSQVAELHDISARTLMRYQKQYEQEV